VWSPAAAVDTVSPRVPSFRFEADLVWRFQHAAGDCGARGQSYEPTSVSVGLAPEGPSDRVLAAAGRARRIDEALASPLTGSSARRVLAAAYSLPLPVVARLDAELLGELAPVVVLRHGLSATCERVAEARRDALARIAVREWVEVAIVEVRHAQARYVRAWGAT
jgi:hypothetical protein